MKCPSCLNENREGSTSCAFCGYAGPPFPGIYQQPPLQKPPQYQPPPQPPYQPPRVIIQRSSEGPFSCLIGALNFALAAVVIGLIVCVVLVLLCVVQLPDKFPLINLPDQLDLLWSRAVALQDQVCEERSGGSTPPVVQPQQSPVEQKKPKKDKDKIKPEETEPPIKEEPKPTPTAISAPPCSSDLGESDCKNAGGTYRVIFDMKNTPPKCVCP